ncbi:NAD(P)-dependent oxidoreductase [Neorhizobium petrolearium]|uniref:NAD(P)-dependent oxidoreductase n=1 Tax=Neorhizobium petrolearium TaxID=515361 RepID=UPI003F152EEF
MTDRIIGFIGLGNMGSHMAAHLVKAGYEVLAYDIDANRRAAFAQEHGTALPDAPADLARASVIMTMVPTGAVVRAVLEEGGEKGLLANLKPGSLVIDTTSSPPESTRELGAHLARYDVSLIDAPVSGGWVGARDANLVFMMGGDSEEAVDRAAAVLSHLGKKIFRLGKLGSGHVMKSMNNYVSAAAYVGACEALIIGRQYGLDPAMMVEVFNVSTARSFATETSIKRIIAGNEARNFALDLFTKDIKIAADLADAKAVKATVTHAVHDRMAEARDAIGGYGDHTKAYSFWATEVGEGDGR